MLNKDNFYYHNNGTFEAEFIGGFLFLINFETDSQRRVRLNNERGQNVTLGQFNDSCKTHGFDKACGVFWKLGV